MATFTLWYKTAGQLAIEVDNSAEALIVTSDNLTADCC